VAVAHRTGNGPPDGKPDGHHLSNFARFLQVRGHGIRRRDAVGTHPVLTSPRHNDNRGVPGYGQPSLPRQDLPTASQRCLFAHAPSSAFSNSIARVVAHCIGHNGLFLLSGERSANGFTQGARHRRKPDIGPDGTRHEPDISSSPPWEPSPPGNETVGFFAREIKMPGTAGHFYYLERKTVT
jgi:hypothetical protein